MKIKDELDSLDAQIDNILDSVDRTTEDYMYAVEEIAALRREVLDLRVNRIGLLRMIARLQRDIKKHEAVHGGIFELRNNPDDPIKLKSSVDGSIVGTLSKMPK